jgi:hypothetical protein
MDWRHMPELLAAGEQVYDSLLNVCVWSKDNGGMGPFYRSQHEMVFVYKNGKGAHRNNVQLGKFGRYRTNVRRVEGGPGAAAEGTGAGEREAEAAGLGVEPGDVLPFAHPNFNLP